MAGGVRISEKHGVNPSMGQCFWCGGDDGTILLVGRLPGDKEAPRRIFHSYDPCDECKTNMALGIALVEAREFENFDRQPLIQKQPNEVYPTGRWIVMKPEAVNRVFHGIDMEAIAKHKKVFIDPEAFERILEMHKESQKEGEA